VRIVDVTVIQLIEVVAHGRADLAIGPDQPSIEGVERQTLFVDRWVVWCPPGHPLERLSAVRRADLAGFPVIMPGHEYPSSAISASTPRRLDTLPDAAAALLPRPVEVLRRTDLL
jgi:DNA-binding transcriptional LysR family regulator